ncbi:helix-turn-helix domain-containing protein [Methylobacterium sp. E-016]|uniref:helix-turn-helix domain-containing protein n=1 Tax=Methylobacterium sp. E-016 TaxID=2836556 RepID=UPI001FBBF55A|nr:helix-turn-helix domain-containing protein [Methylobacterium sp. E-016]MCJ2077897.1 helix-turn-helix domain-containing protein [Methylobacterium sp. E-016]
MKMDETKRSQALTITVEEASRRLGIGKNQAYEAAGRGEIPTIRIGRRLLVPLTAFERLLDGPAISRGGVA